MFSFEVALAMIKHGHRMKREGWNGKNMWVELQRPDEHSKMTSDYIFIKTADNHMVPWLASQTDLLADDWSLF